MAEVVARLNDITKGDAILVSDVGQHQMVVCRYARLNHTRSNITSGGLGTMGFVLPAGLGAALASRQLPVVAVIGDGGIQMTIQELGTLMQTQARSKLSSSTMLTWAWSGNGRSSFTKTGIPL